MRNFVAGVRYFARGLGWVARRPGQWLFGLIPALIVLILIASLANEEFKLTEVIGNIIALSVLCTLVFKVGLGMNIYILRGVW